MLSDIYACKASPEISRSMIYVHGGFLILPNLFCLEDLKQLQAEAHRVKSTGHRNVCSFRSDDEERGGSPDRAFTSSQGDAVQWSLLAAPGFEARLEQACGLKLAITGGGSYSYYEQPGDFLGLHRDIVSCELTVITCLRSVGAEPGAGMLLVYSDYMNVSLANARSAAKAAATQVPISCGESVALLGGFVPHEVTPMLPGQERIVSVACFRVR